MAKRIFAAVIAATTTFAMCGFSVSAEPFIEYERFPEISDAVAVARCAAGDPVNVDGIRLDVNCDGTVSQDDAENLMWYVSQYSMFDSVYEYLATDECMEPEDLFRMELSEQFNAPLPYVGVFSGIRPDQILWLYPDCVMVDKIVTIADGGQTGYAVTAEPYFGDVVYNFDYECGDIVVIYNVFVEGDPNKMMRSDEFLYGNVSELGFEYEPRPAVVANAMRNLE